MTIRRLALLTTLFVLLAPASLFAAVGNGKLQIHHVDVGQGDGALVITPGGQTALFDDGTYVNCTAITAYLQSLGLTTIDYHLESHHHADHIGCIDDLAAAGITIGIAGYDRGYSYSSSSYTSYTNTLGAKRRTITKGQVITLDSLTDAPVTITCIDLNGAGVYSVSGSDENPKSVVLKLHYKNFDEELGGDLTGSTSQSNDVETTVGPEVGHVAVYKVHHHGSRYSTNDNWLNATTPQIAIISCGDGNSYGHPTTDALTRLHNHSVKTYWTETGTGAIPNPTWDRVAHGNIDIQCCGEGATADTFTVSGPDFADSYTITHAPTGVGAGGGPGGPDAAAGLALRTDRLMVGRGSASFRISSGADVRVDLEIVDAGGRTVASVVHSALARAGQSLDASWDGSTAGGGQAPAGVYRAVLRVSGGRVVTSDRVVVLH